ncbi:MAG: PD-(D/E)XK nuclease family protein [Synergistaceae bacterium]|nr:PD-(D/E)XK nuclease family protein [Synergistaceae bacterium]
MSKVLSASKCGFPCERNLFYSVNNYEGNSSSHSQRIFDVGSALEPVIVEWLRSDGWNVEYNQGSQNAPLEVAIDVSGGQLIGHPDCIISRPDGLQNVLIDIKTMNERSFTLWKKEGSLKSKPQYVKQLHVYAAGLMAQGRTIEKLGIVGVNKNNSEMHMDFFDFDENIMKSISESAQRVFSLTDVPLINSPSESWCCNYCEFSKQCNLSGLPPIPATNPELPPMFTDSDVVIEAMHELVRAREMAKEAKTIEDNAKNVLDEHIRQKGLSSVEGGGYVCTISERKSMRFDSAGFKKVHPDLMNQFMKESVSVTYTVKEA